MLHRAPSVVEPVEAPVIPIIVEPVEAPVIHDVIPLSNLDTQNFTDAIDIIIFQMEQGLYLEYRFSSDLNKAQRKIIYDKCNDKNIEFVKSGTRYVIVTIMINNKILENEPKSDLGKELTTLSNIERPRADNVDKILTVVEEPVKRKRGRRPKNK